MIFFTVVGVVMLVSALLFYAGFDWQFGKMPLVQLIFGLYFLVLLPLLIYFKSRKSFNAKSRVAERMAWTVDPEWITVRSESFETKMTWDKVQRVVETKEVFLVYQNKLAANIVSKREMSRAQLTAFRKIVGGVLGLKHQLRAD